MQHKKYIAKRLSKDWGFWYTLTTNLDKVRKFIDKYVEQGIFTEEHRKIILDRTAELREAIDKQFMKDACGVIKMVEYLKLEGYKVGIKLIRRLMRAMNLLAIYPKPKLSKRHPQHKIYPYLLRGLKILSAVLPNFQTYRSFVHYTPFSILTTGPKIGEYRNIYS